MPVLLLVACALLVPATAAFAQPVLGSVQPRAVTAGGPAVTLILTGRGFKSTTRITWDGAAIPARFESEGRIEIDVPSTRLLRAASVLIVAVEDQASSDPVTFTINPPIEWITPPALPVATVRQFYSHAFTVAGGTPPIRFSLISGALPAGLHLDGYNGSILGYPASATGSAAGAEFVVRASDSTGAATVQTLRLAVADELRIASGPALEPAYVGKPYSAALKASGAVAAQPEWSITAGALPKGLALETKTGRIAGTAAAVGSSQFTVRLRDSDGRTATAALSIAVVVPVSALAPGAPAAYVEGDAVELRLAAQGGLPAYTWTLAEGQLPAGLALAAEGVLRGMLELPGSYRAVLRVRDSAGAEASLPLEFRVNPRLQVISSPTPVSALVGVDFALPLEARGGVPPYRWRVAAGVELPGGLRLEAARLAGRPIVTGRHDVYLEVIDAGERTALGRWQIEVTPAPLPALIAAIPDTIEPLRQQSVTLRLERPYPLDLEAEFSIAFEPAQTGGPDDPAVLLSTGGRSALLRLPAGQTALTPALRLQAGTTAGSIVWKLRFGEVRLEGRSVIPPAPPSIRSLAAQRTADGFEVVAVALSPTRQLDIALFAFDDALQVSVPLDKTIGDWYGAGASAPHGTAFVYRQRFTVQGDSSRVRGVSLVLRNAVGSSLPVSAAF